MQYGNFLGADPCGICPGSHLADASHKAAGTNRAVPLHGETRHSALRADELRAYPFSRVTQRLHSLCAQEGGTTARIRNAAVMLPQDNSVKGASSPLLAWLRLRLRLYCGRPFTRPTEQFQRENAPVRSSGRPRSCFHRYAAARRASMLFMPCPVQPATKTSQCPACPCRGRSKTPDPDDRGFAVLLSGINRQRKKRLASIFCQSCQRACRQGQRVFPQPCRRAWTLRGQGRQRRRLRGPRA